MCPEKRILRERCGLATPAPEETRHLEQAIAPALTHPLQGKPAAPQNSAPTKLERSAEAAGDVVFSQLMTGANKEFVGFTDFDQITKVKKSGAL
jgi:hypothetical protein